MRQDQVKNLDKVLHKVWHGGVVQIKYLALQLREEKKYFHIFEHAHLGDLLDSVHGGGYD